MTCIHDYHQLINSLAAEITRVAKLHAATISCGPGCSSCCLAFSVLPIEAACVQEAIASLDRASRERLDRNRAKGDACCPLLIDDLCAIYAARPVICRTQGLPLVYVDAEREAIEVSACPLNFSDDFAFAPKHLLFMDEFNAILSELNRAWCRKQGLAPTRRIPLREIARLPPPET